ncbi:MAG: chromosomal replication initiator protein DnaA [Parachlamydiales bacterium]|nr:chromosomal replication initiator protein DnaA [Parachlamydiales bacterium]
MLTDKQQKSWAEFLDCIQGLCSNAEFHNWIAPIQCLEETETKIVLEVPNIFVQEYLLENFKEQLLLFLPTTSDNKPSIEFTIKEPTQQPQKAASNFPLHPKEDTSFNQLYTFENFIEGPSNQFVKSAALGVAHRPGKSFNPLFIHGGVGLGKTHLLHGIGHYIHNTHKRKKSKCITTEAFINDLVFHLRNKSIDQMKNFYRSLDVLLVDDIQFLQNRLNFEEELCNTFESLINQNKQIVITSDKPPSQLKLSERMIARMEWGLVAHIGMPELETRIAITQHKAQQRGLQFSDDVIYFIADHSYDNVRQIEGAINRLCAYAHLMHVDITKAIAESVLKEMLQYHATQKVSVEGILKSVSLVFDVRIADLKGESRMKNIALARQVAMYLAKELINDSLTKIAMSFGGKTHSTLLHAAKKIEQELKTNLTLSRQIQMVKRNIQE